MENRKKVELIRRKYPIGTRIKLNYMKDDYPVPSGTCGTVDYVDDEGNIGMKWDNGRTLSLIYDIDNFQKIDENLRLKGKNKINSQKNIDKTL